MSISHRLRRFREGLTPRHIINLCFVMVFIFTTILFWRQGSLLRQGYETNQLGQVENVTAQLQSRMQYRIDNLRFLRNYMSFSLQATPSVRQQEDIVNEMERIRNLDTWQINPADAEGAPIFGINPQRLTGLPLFRAADDQQLIHELNATLRLRSLLPLIDVTPFRQPRLYYVSRSGFYLSAPPPNGEDTEELYRHMVTQSYFTQVTKSADPLRIPYWTHIYHDLSGGMVITASLPIDYKNLWIGALSMDFTVEKLRQYLIGSAPPGDEGVYLLFDNRFLTVTSSDPTWFQGKYFTPEQRETLKKGIGTKRQGTVRLGTRFITFNKLDSIGATLVHVQNLSQGLTSEYGRLSLLLTALWMVFAILLLVAHRTILRLINNMEGLQAKLGWRASHDAMTLMLNRASLFQLGEEAAEEERRNQRPLSVIQMDLDHFKNVNDQFGHQTGDHTLIHAAEIIRRSVRTQDLAGRVGGEEFCMLLPGASHQQATDIAERIRANLAATPLQTAEGKTLSITASLGVVCSEETGSYNVEHLQLIADRRLYRAKASGRNRVCSEGESGAAK